MLILIEHIAYGMFRFLDVGFCIFVVFVSMFRRCLLYFSPFVSFLFFQFASGPSLREQECAAVVVADRAASDFSRAAGAKGPHAPQARVDLRP